MSIFKNCIFYACCFVLSACLSLNAQADEASIATASGVNIEPVAAESRWAQTAREVIFSALSMAGTPYKFGGSTPETGLDCSGLVKYVFQQAANLTLPHSARALSQLGRVIRRDELQPGDLVFFNTLQSAYSHVGIYLGDNRFIHAPRTGAQVRTESLGVGYWLSRFTGARRLDKATENTIATGEGSAAGDGVLLDFSDTQLEIAP